MKNVLARLICSGFLHTMNSLGAGINIEHPGLRAETFKDAQALVSALNQHNVGSETKLIVVGLDQEPGSRLEGWYSIPGSISAANEENVTILHNLTDNPDPVTLRTSGIQYVEILE